MYTGAEFRTGFQGEKDVVVVAVLFCLDPFHLAAGLNNMILKIRCFVLILKATRPLTMHMYTKHVCVHTEPRGSLNHH